jgi:hypothetical protein
MSDIFGKVTADQDIIKKLLSKIPGFSGYIERVNRRASDKILREFIANHYEEQWRRISSIQRDLISQGNIEYVDDVEAAALKLRQFIDRVKTAAYGYAGFFDAVKINEDELAAVYQYDAAMLAKEEDLARAIDNLETSMGSDGFPAAIRNLVSIAQQCLDAYNKRIEVMQGVSGASQSQ